MEAFSTHVARREPPEQAHLILPTCTSSHHSIEMTALALELEINAGQDMTLCDGVHKTSIHNTFLKFYLTNALTFPGTIGNMPPRILPFFFPARSIFFPIGIPIYCPQAQATPL
jgi:hypothetical protein